MWLPTLLLLGLAAADVPTVAVMPFSGDEGVTRAETKELNRWLRASMQASPTEIKLLRRNKRDRKDARKCGMDEKCLSDLAFVRGADAIVAGSWRYVSDELVLTAIVAKPQATSPVRRFERVVEAKHSKSDWMAERIWREAFLPDSLRGSLWISGSPEGAMISVDGVELGTLPLEAAIDHIPVGERKVVLSKAGYRELRKTVEIEFQRRTEERFVLVALPAEDSATLADARTGADDSAWVPWTLGGTGMGLVSAGIATGLVTLWLQQEVETRAAKQLLYFPRDEKLIQSGQTLALATNLLWGAGILACTGAGLWFVLDEKTPGDDTGATP